ncbi:MAG TPA: ABC transporter substrate-binding protein [Caulifigura sp.]|nr:ABC transporter substrate-binding protein [Caulifigura sp.]
MPPATPPVSAEEAAGLVTLPKLEEVVYPSTEELLRGPARDWVILNTDEVIISEPVAPRPNTLEQLEAAHKAKEKDRRGKTGAELETFKRELDDLRYVNVILPGPPPLEVRVIRTKVAKIIHHEDHILLRVDALLKEKNIELANELLIQLQRQWPDWPGLAERMQAFLLADASERLAAGDAEACLMLAAELKAQKADYPGLSELAGQAADRLVKSAQETGDHIRARYYLMRLDDLFPGHPVFQQLSQGYATQAQSLMTDAVAAGKAGKFADAATLASEAVKAWPRLASLKAPHKSATERYQRLTVGVLKLAGDPKATPFPTEAEARAQRLVQFNLFEIDDYRGGVPHYRTSYLDEWEPFDLGRRMKFSLSLTRQPWEAHPPADATRLVAGLTDALDVNSPAFDERLASYLKSVTLSSPSEFEVTFARVPVRIESVMRSAPLTSAEPAAPLAAKGALQPVAFQSASATPDVTGGFPLASSDGKQAVFRRARLEPNGLERYHVSEIIEKRYENAEKALRGLQEGEVAMLPDLPDWIIRRVTGNKDFEKQFFIQKYAMPTTHVLQLNPKSRPLAFRELRRALFQAIDRERLLYEIVLREEELAQQVMELNRMAKDRPAGDEEVAKLRLSLRDRKVAAHGRVTNSPFPQFSYATSPRLPEQPYDLSSAVAMTIAVGSQMGGNVPVLRMAVPPEEIPQAIAKKLIAVWARIGINVEIVAEGDSWDLAYRTLQLEEPITDLWTFLTVQPHARVEDLTPFPDWLKQELIALDRASDWNKAVDLSQTLHRHLWSDMRYLPLWELDGYMIYRKQVRGVPTDPLHCYEQIDRWNVEAWYATDTN